MQTKRLVPGQKVQLLPDKLPHVKIREWKVMELLTRKRVMLEHKGKGYTLEVEEGDIEQTRK